MATSSKPAQRGRQREVLDYLFRQTPGKHVTVSELSKEFKGRYSHSELMNTMAQICLPRTQERYHIPVRRITTGVWTTTLHEAKTVTELPNNRPQYHQLEATVERVGFVDPGTPGAEVVMGPINKDSQSFMNDIRDAVGPVEPDDDRGVWVKVRNGTLYVDGVVAGVESFINGIRLAVRIS